jgi:hypothetical protein
MVLLAAAICTKGGKALVSRQFVEMTRSRIEGLLASFPKLIGAGKQHTFIETDSVRYVYQPLEKLYMVLITTKASNILEDLETLRLFSRVIPEYCKTVDEKEVHDHAFDLLFAFDEIVALGYRENVNLAQIRTFTDMDSLEEKVFKAKREAQERDAKEKMLEKAKELQRLRLENKKQPSRNSSDGFSGGFGSSSMSAQSSSLSSSSQRFQSSMDSNKPEIVQPPSFSSGSGSKGNPMRLGGSKPLPAFLEQTVKQSLPSPSGTTSGTITNQSSTSSTSNFEKVHLKLDEKLTLVCGKDNGLQNLEVHGILYLRVESENDGKIKIHVQNNDQRSIQLQTHPNVDKKLYTKDSLIALKDLTKSFPPGQDVGVLKWRFQTTDESEIPLTINCWPSQTKDGCDVNIEYELLKTNLELNDVVFTIPIPSNVAAPIIKQCDGDYSYEKNKNQLKWCITTLDESNSTGSLEFSVAGRPQDFFPVKVNFTSKNSYCDISVTKVTQADNSSIDAKYSSETSLNIERYEIV